jgi:predicted 3-demethylubiquinone-9 3-methyltransferase (glyoxalase superfamily)
MQKITPHLWFDRQAREAAEFYVSVLPGSRLTHVTTLSNTPSGDCDVVSFELAGAPFMAISSGPSFKFNPSVSFQIKCATKNEVDALWEQLSPGGKVLMPLDTYPFSARFGWLEDRYGLSWQVMQTSGGAAAQKISPMLMFVGAMCGKAEEAINFYASMCAGAPCRPRGETKATVLDRYSSGEQPDQEGTLRYAQFSLFGQDFAAMDSAHAHNFKFNEAISFLIPCDTQQEIDYFWNQLSAHPDAEQCGWLKDKYGLSWQVAPAVMGELLGGNDTKRVERVTRAFLKMKKFDIAALKQAAADQATI